MIPYVVILAVVTVITVTAVVFAFYLTWRHEQRHPMSAAEVAVWHDFDADRRAGVTIVGALRHATGFDPEGGR